MSKFSFWRFRMPATNNAIQGLKHAVEKERYDWAEKNADSAENQLNQAREETLEAIRKRDAGESREDDPDVRDGIRY